MAHSSVVTAVNQVLTAWTLCPVIELNTTMDPPVDQAFLVVEYPASRTTRLSVGTRLYREEGGIRLMLSVPQGKGITQLLSWSDQLATLFRDQKVGSVRFKVPSSPYLDDANDDGAYMTGATVVPYFMTFNG